MSTAMRVAKAEATKGILFENIGMPAPAIAAMPPINQVTAAIRFLMGSKPAGSSLNCILELVLGPLLKAGQSWY